MMGLPNEANCNSTNPYLPLPFITGSSYLTIRKRFLRHKIMFLVLKHTSLPRISTKIFSRFDFFSAQREQVSVTRLQTISRSYLIKLFTTVINSILTKLACLLLSVTSTLDQNKCLKGYEVTLRVEFCHGLHKGRLQPRSQISDYCECKYIGSNTLAYYNSELNATAKRVLQQRLKEKFYRTYHAIKHALA